MSKPQDQVLLKKEGYEMVIMDGVPTIKIDESAFIEIVKEKEYSIVCRSSDGEKFFRTAEYFCHILEIHETSKGEAMLVMETLPDSLKAIFCAGELAIFPPKNE